MEKKRIAMVEEATGKGYEITIGTFIGRNQGKVTEIKDSSIVVTELIKDFKGKLKEQTQEIKLHKNDDEE
jgi:type IV pilus assembly protein PilP